MLLLQSKLEAFRSQFLSSLLFPSLLSLPLIYRSPFIVDPPHLPPTLLLLLLLLFLYILPISITSSLIPCSLPFPLIYLLLTSSLRLFCALQTVDPFPFLFLELCPYPRHPSCTRRLRVPNGHVTGLAYHPDRFFTLFWITTLSNILVKTSNPPL